MMQKAKERLEDAGWQVVAASLAPASDQYILHKMRRLGRPDREALALDLRVRTCEAVSADLEWLSCDPRGKFYRSAPHMAWKLLSKEHPGVVLFSVIGADVARKGVRDDCPHVVVSRAGSKLQFETNEKCHHYVAELGEDTGFHGFSSTHVREAMRAGNWDGVAQMCGEGAADLLREHSGGHPPAEATRGKKRSLREED